MFTDVTVSMLGAPHTYLKPDLGDVVLYTCDLRNNVCDKLLVLHPCCGEIYKSTSVLFCISAKWHVPVHALTYHADFVPSG